MLEKNNKIQLFLDKFLSWKTLFILLYVFLISGTLLDSSAFDLPFGPNKGQIMPDEEVLNSDVEDKGAAIITGSFVKVVETIRMIIGSLVVLWITFYGLRMVSAGGNEEIVDASKRGVVWGIIGLGLVLLSEPILKDTLYGGGDLKTAGVFADPETAQAAVGAGKMQIMAFFEWFKAIIVTLTMLYLVYSGWEMIQAMGNQEEISNQKTAVFWIAIGMLLIVMNEIIIDEIIYRIMGIDDNWTVVVKQDPERGISEFMGIIKYALQFAALFAFIAFVAGGAMFIFSFGNDDTVSTAKNIMISAVIGLIIIGISYAVTTSLITGVF